MDSHQDASKGKEDEALQGKDKGKDKKKDSSKPAKKASDTTISQPEQAADLGVPKALRILVFVVYLFFMFIVFVSYFC